MPDWFALLLLTAAAYRTWRLLAVDSIMAIPRDWLTRRSTYHSKDRPGKYRPLVDQWLGCPWCAGFWIGAVWYGAFLVTEHTLYAAVLFAISLGVGLIQHNWDS